MALELNTGISILLPRERFSQFTPQERIIQLQKENEEIYCELEALSKDDYQTAMELSNILYENKLAEFILDRLIKEARISDSTYKFLSIITLTCPPFVEGVIDQTKIDFYTHFDEEISYDESTTLALLIASGFFHDQNGQYIGTSVYDIAFPKSAFNPRSGIVLN